jgi:hypothetical protein
MEVDAAGCCFLCVGEAQGGSQSVIHIHMGGLGTFGSARFEMIITVKYENAMYESVPYFVRL